MFFNSFTITLVIKVSKERSTTLQGVSLPYPTNKAFKVFGLREGKQDGMIRTLGELLYNLYLPPGIETGSENHLLKQVRSH